MSGVASHLALAAAGDGTSGKSRSPAVVLVGLGILLVLTMAFSLGVGRFAISPGRTVEILGGAIHGTGDWAMDQRIVLLVRAPRILLAALAGAGLALTGCALQAIFRNPLVSAQVLGISPGAAFGGVLAILLGWWGIPLLASAFVFGLFALVLVGFVARVDGRTEIVTVILAGLVVGSLFAAAVSLAQFLADPNGSLQSIVFWLMGSLATSTWERVGLAGPGLVLGGALLVALRYRLNLLSLDEAEARSLGLDPGRERWTVFALVTLVVSSQVAVSGVIGWIGLVVPHAARYVVGADHRALVPASALMGAILLVLVDTLGRSIAAAEIPLGVLTAFIGAPVFAILLRRHYRERRR